MLIKCPNCGDSISNQASHCPHCGAVVKKQSIMPLATSKNNTKWLLVMAIILAILGSCFLFRGFYVKNKYANNLVNNDSYDDRDNINAYVGGDAYNYIINGTYFTGFMALSGSMYICATGLLCTFLIMYNSKGEKNIPKEKTIIDKAPVNCSEELPEI